MKITVYGTGYVGLVAGACFADAGNEVLAMDVDRERVQQLTRGIIPIYEPGLAEVIQRTLLTGNLRFTHNAEEAVAHGICQFIAVGTPSDFTGKADLGSVWAVVQTIAALRNDYTIIVNKSTVPVGTADRVRVMMQEGLAARGVSVVFDVVSNPEFLKEGRALHDFKRPDRVIIGTDAPRAQAYLRELYAPFCQTTDHWIVMDIRSAELTKYAANAMLATKISFMNEMANIAERVGANIDAVRRGIGSDPRIGEHFIYAGCGYGGSCFGKDLQALSHTAREQGCSADIIEAVEHVNAKQKRKIVEKIMQYYGTVAGKIFAVWGLAFKPETDDMRDAPSQVVIQALLDNGAVIRAYDPKAKEEAQKIFGKQDNVLLEDTPEAVLVGAQALIILTEWECFKQPNFRQMQLMLKTPVIFDGRNLYDPNVLKRLGFIYHSIGRESLACEIAQGVVDEMA